MRRRRLNLKLLIILCASALITAVGVHFLHKYMQERNAGALLTLATQAEEAGEPRKAAGYLRTYVKFRPMDVEGYVRWANLTADLTEVDDAEPNDFLLANSVLETALLKSPDDHELRRRLVDIKMRIGRLREARENLQILVKVDPTNMENQVLLAQCMIGEGNLRGAERLLYSLIGYDYETGTFDPKKAPGAKHVPAYVTLAQLLRTQLEYPEQADSVMDQMVAVNGDDFRAYLERGSYAMRHGQDETAVMDIERAVSMAPQDLDVLLVSAEMELGRGNIEKAEKQLDVALENYPDQARVYRARASLEITEHDDPQAALGYIQRGLEAVEESRTLLSYQAEMQLRAGELDQLDKTMESMITEDLEQEVISFYRARKMLAEQQWVAGARELEKLRPLVARWPERQMEINLYLGLCYERLGQPDRALEAYQMALRADARQVLAREGIHRVQLLMGHEQREAADPFSRRVASILELPETERDWQEIDALLDKHIQENKLSEPVAATLKARLLGMKSEFAAAENLLAPMRRQYPDNTSLWLLSIELARQDPQRGVTAAKELTQQATAALGDSVELRLAQGVLLLQEQRSSESLLPLEEDIEKFSRAEKRKLWAGLAGLHMYVASVKDVRRLWLQLAEDNPNDLSIRLQLLELAIQENELSEVEAAQQAILNLVKTQDDSAWQYAEAGRLVVAATNQSENDAQLERALKHIDQVLKTRSQWHLAHALRGRILLQLKRYDDAIAALQRSTELGKPRISDLRQLVQLLTYQGRFDEAQKAMALAGQEERLGIRPEVLAEIHLRSGDMQQGMDVAQQAVEQDPDNGLKLLWYGQVLVRSNKFNEAGAVFKKAMEASPRMPQPYMALIALLAQQEQEAAARTVMRLAEKNLDPQQRLVVLARGEELLGNSPEAERYYQQALAEMPNNTVRLRALATFYLNGGYQGADGIQKAYPLVNRVLQTPATGVTKDDDISWARRAMATIRATGGTYPDLIAALKWIEQNSKNGRLSREDQLQAATILALRPEAVSRRKAIRYLQELQSARELPIREQLLLAGLYNQMDDWESCRATMLQIVSRHGKDPRVLAAFARLLLEHKQLDQAERYITRLEQVEPTSYRSRSLRADYLKRKGKPEAAAALLTQDLPARPSSGDTKDMAKVFLLLRELKLYAAAEKIMRQMVEIDSRNRAALAEFLGLYRNYNEAFSILHSLEGSVAEVQLAQAGLAILNARRAEIGTAYDPQVENWLNKARQKSPQDSAVLLATAQFAEIQERYLAEEEAYRQLLENKDTQGNRRALVLNNLAFNMAMRNKSTAETRQLVDEAIEIHGPTGALLDTRAMVSLFAGEHDRAISDLNLAISDEPKPERLFHLALAQLEAGNKEAALRALREAQRRGLDEKMVSRLEQSHYDRLVKELGIAPAAAENDTSQRIFRQSQLVLQP